MSYSGSKRHESRLEQIEPFEHGYVDPKTFANEFLARGQPGFFPKLIQSGSPYAWPAYEVWSRGNSQGSLDGLREIAELQDTIVEVEVSPVGRGYGDGLREKKNSDEGGWMKVTMPFGIFLDAFIMKKIPWRQEREMVGYVAQQDLFERSPTLLSQCPPLPHQIAGSRGNKEQWRRNLWIGGKGSFTPIHRDPYQNIFVQVVGRKRVHLFPPSTAPHLHLFPASSHQPNTSQIPTEEPLLSHVGSKEFPNLFHALSHPDARHVELHKGDALFIPQGWLHCVQSLSVSASVNAWFR